MSWYDNKVRIHDLPQTFGLKTRSLLFGGLPDVYMTIWVPRPNNNCANHFVMTLLCVTSTANLDTIYTLILILSKQRGIFFIFLMWFMVRFKLIGSQLRQQKGVPRQFWTALVMETCTWLSHLGWRQDFGSKPCVQKYSNGASTHFWLVGLGVQRRTRAEMNS